jgi:hypothetical protein
VNEGAIESGCILQSMFRACTEFRYVFREATPSQGSRGAWRASWTVYQDLAEPRRLQQLSVAAGAEDVGVAALDRGKASGCGSLKPALQGKLGEEHPYVGCELP